MKANLIILEDFLSSFKFVTVSLGKLFYLFLFFLAFAFGGCSTIFTGTHQAITFNSNPTDAIVYVDGKAQCSTPCTAGIKKGTTHDIVISKDGYRDYKTVLSNRKNHWTVWLNLVTLNIGWYLDAATGASEHYINDSIAGNLIRLPEKIKSSQPVSIGNINVSLKGKEIGNKYKKNMFKGVIFIEDNTFNQERFKSLATKEFEEVGFVMKEDSELKIQPNIIELMSRQDEHKKGRFLNSTSITVKWDIISNGEVVYTSETKGSGVWPSVGSTSIELAFKEALYRFLLIDELYSIAKATI
jgi:hypothetical protein